MPRKVKKLTQTKLLRKFEPEMREIIRARDGNKCQVEGINHTCSETLVADHRPSKRGHHATFLDPRNLTLVCSAANFRVEFDPFISDAICGVVREREGKDIIETLRQEARQKKKWTEIEIRQWIDDCKRHFLKNKKGKPCS